MLDDRRKTNDERVCVIASPRSLSEVEVRARQSLTRILSSWRSVAVLERSDRIRSIYYPCTCSSVHPHCLYRLLPAIRR